MRRFGGGTCHGTGHPTDYGKHPPWWRAAADVCGFEGNRGLTEHRRRIPAEAPRDEWPRNISSERIVLSGNSEYEEPFAGVGADFPEQLSDDDNIGVDNDEDADDDGGRGGDISSRVGGFRHGDGGSSDDDGSRGDGASGCDGGFCLAEFGDRGYDTSGRSSGDGLSNETSGYDSGFRLADVGGRGGSTSRRMSPPWRRRKR